MHQQIQRICREKVCGIKVFRTNSGKISFATQKKDRVPRETFGECCWSMVLMAACHWPWSHCIPAQKFVSVSVELTHNRSPWVLDSDKGVCCHHSFYELDRQLQPNRRQCHYWKLRNRPFSFCGRFRTASIFWTRPSACTWSVLRCVRSSVNKN